MHKREDLKTDWSEYKPEHFSYRGKWIDNWFSNMVESPMVIDGITYLSNENYFQAQKSLSEVDHKRIAKVSPSESKKEGHKLNLRSDWDDIKYDVMKHGLRVKFTIPEWKEKLLATGEEVLVEWTNWNDKIWGTDENGQGFNLLGLALMEIRQELREGKL